jgi:hypothetical protein
MFKAFSKVSHEALFINLMKRNIPVQFLNILINWYRRCSAVVRWDNVISNVVNFLCGVRQRGMLSPVLFALCVNDINDNLKLSKLGCQIGDFYFGCLMYAVLLSPSLNALQEIMCICELEAIDINMCFNLKKSSVITSAKEVMFSPLSVCHSFCLSVCSQDISKSYERISLKPSGMIGHEPRTNL